MKCARCGSRMLTESDKYGKYDYCILCGNHVTLESRHWTPHDETPACHDASILHLANAKMKGAA